MSKSYACYYKNEQQITPCCEKEPKWNRFSELRLPGILWDYVQEFVEVKKDNSVASRHYKAK